MAHQLLAPATAEEHRIPMTYEAWLAWSGDSTRSEWVDGEAIVFMPTKPVHGDLSAFLTTVLRFYVRRRGLGQLFHAGIEMRLGPTRSSREPDIVFVATANLGRITDDRLEGPADLVVEIVSDDSVTRDRRDKLREYAAAGIPEYWIFDPRPGKRTHDFYRLGAGGDYRAVPLDAAGRYHSIALPGFWLDPEWLWQTPLPDEMDVLDTIAPDLRRAPRSLA